MCYSRALKPPNFKITRLILLLPVLSIRAFMKQRRNFNAVVNGHSQMEKSRYTRLMALAATDIVLDLPLSIFIFWSNVRSGFHPWVSWTDTHYNFSSVSVSQGMGAIPRHAKYSRSGNPNSYSSPPGDSRVVGGHRNYKMGLANFRDHIFWILRSCRRVARFLPRLFQETPRLLWH